MTSPDPQEWTPEDRPLPEYYPPTVGGLSDFLATAREYLEYLGKPDYTIRAHLIAFRSAFLEWHFPLYNEEEMEGMIRDVGPCGISTRALEEYLTRNPPGTND